MVLIMTEQEFSLTGTSLGVFANHVVNHSKIPVMSVAPREVDASNITVGY